MDNRTGKYESNEVFKPSPNSLEDWLSQETKEIDKSFIEIQYLTYDDFINQQMRRPYINN